MTPDDPLPLLLEKTVSKSRTEGSQSHIISRIEVLAAATTTVGCKEKRDGIPWDMVPQPEEREAFAGKVAQMHLTPRSDCRL